MLNVNGVLYDRNFIIIAFMSGPKIPENNSENSEDMWVLVDTFPDNFENPFISGKWMYDPENNVIYENPEYQKKEEQNLWYDPTLHEWIPNPWYQPKTEEV